MEVVKSVRESLSKRLSFRRSTMREFMGKHDELSNNLVQYRGISVTFLENFVQDVQTGKIGPDLELVELKQRVDNVDDEGAVLQVLERNKANGTLKVRAKKRNKIVSIKENLTRPRRRISWTIGDVHTFIINEESKAQNLSYVQILENAGKTANVGKAFQGAYLSVARETSFVELLEGIKQECARNHRSHDKQFLWLDIFGTNFSQLEGKEQELLFNLEQGIKEFDTRWVFLGSWINPVPLHRMWCAWEIRQMGKGMKAIFIEDHEPELIGRGRVDAIIRTIQNGRLLTQSYAEENRILSHTKVENLKSSLIAAVQTWMVQSTTQSLVKLRPQFQGLQLAELLEQAGDIIIFVYRDQATIQQQHNNVHAAVKYYAEAMALFRKHGKSAKEAELLTKMAAAHEDMRELDLALSRYKKAFFIHKENNDARNVAMTLSQIANVWVLKNKYDKALEKYEQACLLVRLIEDKDPLLVADTIINTGNVLAYQQKYQAALDKYEQALLIRRVKLGNNAPEVADILNSIANVYASQTKLDQALSHYRQTLEIYERAYGDTHLTVFVTLNNIAVILNDQGDPTQALSILKQALALVSEVGREDQYKEQHKSQRRQSTVKSTATLASNITNIESLETPDVATTYNNMAVCYDRQKKFDKAMQKYHQALEICSDRLGPQHPKVANIYLNMGISYLESQHKRAEAAVELRNALAIYQANFGEHHPDTKECKELLKRCA